ncbi:hypothetical protein OIU84_025607 [Salix udensis]|uniref:Uncharacterized protein n=1 Tax=Salix udensis TaxID=889485 RepID=A0AAD6KM81_9ROSI|nr:hypothetical protein OIU84_025607 [Salix udensis]
MRVRGLPPGFRYLNNRVPEKKLTTAIAMAIAGIPNLNPNSHYLDETQGVKPPVLVVLGDVIQKLMHFENLLGDNHLQDNILALGQGKLLRLSKVSFPVKLKACDKTNLSHKHLIHSKNYTIEDSHKEWIRLDKESGP